MVKTIALSHDYPFGPETVWAEVTDLEALAEANRPRIVMTGLPAGRIHAGQHIAVGVSLFGLLPEQPYSMDVLLCDNAARHFRSSEHGAGVRRWEHDLRVIETPGGCRIEETILVDAGPLTPLFAAWARYLYRARHPVRMRRLSHRKALP